MGNLSKEKKTACDVIDRESDSLRVLSLDIWEHPELCFEEHHAHEVITNYLEEKGFQVERHYKLETAFRATTCSKELSTDSPHIGVMCEYDALPGIGHGCGHNLIAMIGVAIALGIKEVLDNARLQGKLTVLGCPAEEGKGGKIDLMKAGAYDDLDIALMAHPFVNNSPKPDIMAMTQVDVRFEGKESHAAGFPWEGVNALDAAVLCYQNVSCMRQQMKPTWRVHGVFTKGGEQANIIPSEAALQYYVRTPESKELKSLKDKIIGCFNGAAHASGCKVTYTFDPKSYDSFVSNDLMISLYMANGEAIGIEFETDPGRKLAVRGSTDMGNVSRVLPSIHPMYSLNTVVPLHSTEFRDVSKTESSHNLTLLHAKALAMAVIDVYNDPSLVSKMKDIFKAQMDNENK